MNIKKFALFFCSGFGVGFFPYIPGTIASLAILPVIWIIKSEISQVFFLILILSYFYISFIFLRIILVDKKNMDPNYVVCDEYLGQSIAVYFCNETILDYLIAFILFRILDIIKPFPIKYFDNMKNVTGVLADDIIAGLIVAIIFYFYYAI